MSEHYLVLFPADPRLVPDPERQRRAAARLEGCLEAHGGVTVETTEEVQFISGLSNYEGVDCPFCQADLDDWWGGAMDQAWNDEIQGFRDLSCTTPCCGRATSLNDLAYRWPAGFARFTLRVSGLFRGQLSPEEITELEAILGCRLRETSEHL